MTIFTNGTTVSSTLARSSGSGRASRLSETDLAMFAAIGVPETRVVAAGVRRVTHQEARDDCGIQYKSLHLEGIAFPYYHPRNGDRPVTYRVRRDYPELDTDGKPIAKYVSPPDRKHLYFPVEAVAALLADTQVPIVKVESEKAVLAVMEAFAAAQRTGLAIGTGGCWGWHGRIGKATLPNGAIVDEKGPVPDLDLVTWPHRAVYVSFDTNAAANPSVGAARKKLGSELRKRGARVAVIDLPVEPGINGPDDFIGRYGGEAFLALLDAATFEDEERHKPTRRGSAATQLVELAHSSGIELWHSPRQDPYATILVADRREHHAILGSFQDQLARLYFERHQRVPSSASLKDAVRVLAIEARDASEHPVSVRLAGTSNILYLDLGDQSRQVVEITAAGWRVIADPPVRFWRPPSLRPLPQPAAGKLDHLRELWPFLDDDTWTRSVSWLVAAAAPAGPYPILVETGEAGSGKSTFGRMLRGILDPASPDLRGAPRNEQDLMIAAHSSHIIALDNLPVLPRWVSDALCRISTGGGFGTRTLFANLDETLIDVVRPILMNGIESPATRGDLLDRSLVVTIPTPPHDARADESELWSRYRQALPGLVGGLCDAISMALRRRAEVKLARRPRMADACAWVTAAEPALGWAVGQTLAVWNAARLEASAELLAGNEFAEALLLLERPWCGTATQLKTRVWAYRPTRATHPWPETPQAVAALLTDLAPDLRNVGVDIQRLKRAHGGVRRYLIQDATSPMSPTSPPVDLHATQNDSAVTTGDAVLASSPTHVTTNRDDSRQISAHGDAGDNGDDSLTSRQKGNINEAPQADSQESR